MPKAEFKKGKIVVKADLNNPKDLKKQMKKTKAYQTMSKPELVQLVEKLLEI
jgi:hypothetical protein